MVAWTPIPEPVNWTFPAPIEFNGMHYAGITLRAPKGEDILKATAIPGASGTDVTIHLISCVSVEQVPYDAVKKLPWYLIQQMSGYMDEFAGAPAPDPLEQWRQARRDAMAAEAAEAAAAAASSNTVSS